MAVILILFSLSRSLSREESRLEFRAVTCLFSAEMFVYVDESRFVSFFNGSACLCLRVSVPRIICYIGKIGKVTLRYDLLSIKEYVDHMDIP